MSGAVPDSALGPYRVLDLTEGGYNWCGRILADFGADVIKIEPPGGSPTRKTGPFWHDEVDPERSLFWWAYCLNKRSVTLDLGSAEGSRRFRELAAGADIVLESFTPGYLDGLGLGYQHLRAINPTLVLTSMTPFGQTGPHARYKATDMVSWSMGGMQYVTGDNDRPPVRVSVPQAQLHAGAQGAAGTLVALWRRLRTGEGQHVDVSTQEAVIWTTMNAAPFPKVQGTNLERAGGAKQQAAGVSRTVYACKDGYLSGVIGGGTAGGNSMITLVKWLDSEGYATEAMRSRDWPRWDMYAALSMPGPEAEELLDAQARVAAFFATKTKAEIYERAIADSIIVAPCNTVKDIWESPQLKARKYWVEMDQPGVGKVAFPGPYVKLSEAPITLRTPAPSIGQHAAEVFSKVRTRSPAAPSASAQPGALPFEGLRVLDLSWVGVGPLTMKYLADHGATVVRVESVTRPDPARSVPPFAGGKSGFNRSQFPANFNTSKYGLGLNLAKPEAREVVRRLLLEWKPDILAESFTPKAMKGWGLDYESMRAHRPDLVYYSTCQQGQTGPHSRYAGYGGQAAALAGFYHITGWPDRPPTGPYGAYTDFVNPPNGVAAVIAALEYRRRTGRGQHIDLSQFECAVHYLSPAVLDYVVNGRVKERQGNKDDVFAPHNAYACIEGATSRAGGSWCSIVVTSDQEWQSLCAVAGKPEWVADPRFRTLVDRKRHEDELDRLIGEWTSQHDARELMHRLQGAGVAAGVVQAASDLWDDPHLLYRGFFRWLKHTECGPMPYTGPQFRLSETPSRMRWAAPMVGEHNELVLKEFLGLSDEEIGDLLAAGALETSF